MRLNEWQSDGQGVVGQTDPGQVVCQSRQCAMASKYGEVERRVGHGEGDVVKATW
jgi:hypothetical protein